RQRAGFDSAGGVDGEDDAQGVPVERLRATRGDVRQRQRLIGTIAGARQCHLARRRAAKRVGIVLVRRTRYVERRQRRILCRGGGRAVGPGDQIVISIRREGIRQVLSS